MPVELNHMLNHERIEAMRAAGLWPDRLLIDYLDDAVGHHPDHVAVTDLNSMAGVSTTLSYRQLDRLSRRIGLGLTALGIEKGDVVACQLPNWWQFMALHLACIRIGAILNPLMPIFRERELSYMLGFAESKAIVVPRRFRDFDYPAMVDGIRSELPALEHVLVIGGEGENGFEAQLLNRRWEDEMDAATVFRAGRPEPNDVALLLYTSGTTGAPKGVLHTSNTLLANALAFVDYVGTSADDVGFMASPLAHLTGFLYGLMHPIVLGGRVVLLDVWEPEVAARLIHDEGISFTMGATPFLADLTHTDAWQRYDVSTLARFVSAGAPIPRVLVETANQRLGAHIISGWGMTENGFVTGTRPGDAPEKVFGTDGKAMPGMEVRVVDDAGRPLGPGDEGNLEARGAFNFVGYMKKPELYNTDKDGWFGTGDHAWMDEDGYIRITGRAKDIIIRGGENVPVVEVEELLYRHPAIEDAAIVAMPDPRLGERGCAFVTLKSGQGLNFEDMVAYLLEQKMAKQYLPERLEVVEAMPRTPSGKIQKFKLREIAETLALDCGA